MISIYSKLNCKGNLCVILNTQIKCFYSSKKKIKKIKKIK
jgi:hypothetical protein